MLTVTTVDAKELDKRTKIELDKVWEVKMNQDIVESSLKGKVRITEDKKEVAIETVVEKNIIYIRSVENYQADTEYLLTIQPGIVSTSGSAFRDNVQVRFQTVAQQLPSYNEDFTHTFSSNYDFDWKYKKGDYSQFRLDGVKDGKVVAGYTTSAQNEYGFLANIGDTRDHVIKVLGEPLKSIRKGNTNFISTKQELEPTYFIGNRYVTFLIDQHDNYKVRAVLWVDKDTEERANYWYKLQSDQYRQDSEELMYELLNQSRHAAGLRVLTKNDLLARAARKHSSDMADNNYFNHTNLKGENPSKRVADEGLRPNATGENISGGYQSVILSHHGLMNSLGHRKNILNERYYQLGIGLSFTGESVPYITQNFYIYPE